METSAKGACDLSVRIMKTADVPTDLYVAIVGVGFIGREHIGALQKVAQHRAVPLDLGSTFLVDIDERRAHDVADLFGWRAGTIDELRDRSPSLVIVATPPAAHAEVVLALADTMCRFLVEKPLAPTPRDALLMAPYAGRIVVGLSQRYIPAVSYMRRAVEEGVVGAISSITAQYELRQVPVESGSNWRLMRKHGLGVLGDIGCHAIDMIQFVSGEAMTPLGASLLQRPAIDPRTLSNEDVAACLFSLERGGIGGLHLNRLSRSCVKPSQSLRIVGERATLEWRRSDLDSVRVERPSSVTVVDASRSDHRHVEGQRPTPWPEQFALQMRDVLKWVSDDVESDTLADFEAGRQTLQIAHDFAALGSADSG